MIKKSLFALAMVGCFGAATLFSANTAEAKLIVLEQGSKETIESSSECSSQKKRKCEGAGTVCDKTLGWDCVVTN